MHFSLKQLIAFITGICLFISLVFLPMQYRVRKQISATEAISAAGGTVYYDFEVPVTKASAARKKIAAIVGKDWIGEIRDVEIISCRDASKLAQALSRIKSMRAIECIRLFDCAIDDKCIAELSAMRELRELSLSGTYGRLPKLTGLGGLPNLRELGMSSCRGVDIQVANSVSLMPQLQELDISFSDATDSAAARLAHCPMLLSLYAEYSNVTDRGLIAASKAPRLRSMCVDSSQNTSRLTSAATTLDIEVHWDFKPLFLVPSCAIAEAGGSRFSWSSRPEADWWHCQARLIFGCLCS